MRKHKTKKKYGIWGMGVLLLVLLLVGCEQIKEPQICEVCPECDNEKALLSNFFGEWGENIDDNKEYIFSNSVMNYGFVEAKNIEMTCFINDKAGNRLYETTDEIGNLASTSWKYEEVISIPDIVVRADHIGMCYISSCDNCILLDDRIMDIVESR